MESYERERSRALTAMPVSVIYVSVEEPSPANRCQAADGSNLLRVAICCLRRMTEYVDGFRLSLERYSR